MSTQRIAVVTTFVLALAGALAARAAVPASPPNVLFIAIDDLRDWTGYLGRNPQARTPNLDRIASRGMAFMRAYPAAPVCNPSRAALMTGLRPNVTGVYENNNDWRRVIGPEKCLTTAFRQAGYYVCGAGKIYHEAYARRSEWDDYLTQGGTGPLPSADQDRSVGGIRFGAVDCRDEDLGDSRIVDYGIAELRKAHDKPFFLAVGVHKPHLPWFVPRKYFDLFPLESIQLPPYLENDLDDLPSAGVAMAHPWTDHEPILKSGRWKEAVQAYLAAIAYTDANLGRLFDALETSAYRDNTIVCLWGDHGWHLGEKHHWRKFALWEESTRTPFIWIVPGLTKPGTRTDHPVDLMSVFPTLCGVAGLPRPAHVDGADLRPLLANPSAPWTTPAFTTYRLGNHTVRVDGWRYIHYRDGGEELYDETGDPNEWTNLAGRPAHAARLAALKALLPERDAPDIGGARGQGAEEGMPVEKQERRKTKKTRKPAGTVAVTPAEPAH